MRHKTVEVRMSDDEYWKLVQAAEDELRSTEAEARHRIRQTLSEKDSAAAKDAKSDGAGNETR